MLQCERILDALQRERYGFGAGPIRPLECSVPSVLSSARTVVGRSATYVLGIQRRLTEWQLACARIAERQVTSCFELHRVGLEAGLRFTQVAADTMAGAPSGAVAPADTRTSAAG